MTIDGAVASGDVFWCLDRLVHCRKGVADAFCLAGGPVPERGFCPGRGLARFNKRRIRARCSDPGDGALVDLYRDHSMAPLVDLRRGAQGCPGCYSCHWSFWLHCVWRS